MPEPTELIDRMVTYMQGVASAGKVHRRLRSVRRSQKEFAKLAQLVPHTTDRFRGWFLQYLHSTDHERGSGATEQLEIGQIEIHHHFRCFWILPFNDDAGSTEAHAAMFWDMAEMLRVERSFGYGRQLVKHQLLQGRAPGDPVEVSELKGSMHFGEATLDVYEWRTFPVCR